jgi:hypothetical protein
MRVLKLKWKKEREKGFAVIFIVCYALTSLILLAG